MTAKNINRLASLQFAVCSLQFAVCSLQFAVCSLQFARKPQLMAAMLNMRNTGDFRATGSLHDVGEDLKINCAPTKQCICSY